MEKTEKLPPGWIKVKSKSKPGKVYFYNTQSKESVWKLSDLKTKFSPKKVSNGLSNKSVIIGKKNLAENRMKNLRMALEQEKNETTGCAAPKLNSSKPKATLAINSKDKIPEKKLTSSPRKRALQTVPLIVPGKKLLSPRKRVQEKEKLRSEPSVESMDVDVTSSQEMSKNAEDFVEPMDWEEINIEEIMKEVNSIRSVKSTKSSLLPHYADNDSNDDKFYVVVDTNVFCSNPLFIDRIKGRIFKDIGKACIFIPYIVLCELDLLKTREGNISKAARRGIKTINDYFASKDRWVVGQSIIEDGRELISINSGDDRILNCAFQLKEVTNKIVILSNDINLRNKAFVNGFEVYSVDTLNYADYNTTNNIKFE